MTSADRTKTQLRRRTILAAMIATIGLAGAAGALAQSGPDPVDLQVVDRATGRVLRTWRHHGRLFVAGEPGARYSLRVTNHTPGRVLVVMSVDGVNILTGETASYGQRGYVFDPYQSYDVTGWRKSDTEVAAFAFAPLPQSYAARTGRPADVGVIGMAVFNERAAPSPPMATAPATAPAWRDGAGQDRAGGADSTAQLFATAPSAAYAAPPPPPPSPSFVVPARRAAPSPLFAQGGAAESPRDAKLGTAHGEREWSVSYVVPFERASRYPQSVRQIEYDTFANLRAAGVIPPSPDRERRARPFPSGPDGSGYVPDPPREP